MDAQEAIKKYWPYALGAVIALYFLMRAGGQSQSSDAGAAYASLMAATAAQAQGSQQAALQNHALEIQATANQAGIALQNRGLDIAELEAKTAAQNQFLLAQGSVAQAVGQAASGLVASLYMPQLQAMNSAAYENAAALNAAATVAIGGFGTQASIVESGSKALDAVARGVEGLAQIQIPVPGQQPKPAERMVTPFIYSAAGTLVRNPAAIQQGL